MRWICWTWLAAGCGISTAVEIPPLIGILQQELNRNFAVLKQGDPPAYFLAYAVTEAESGLIAASGGSLRAREEGHTRLLDVTVRVGDPKLDNYHRAGGETPQFTGGVVVSLDDEPAALRMRLWLETDRVYRLAAQRLMQLKTDTKVRAASSDQSIDFSREEPNRYFEPVVRLRFPAEPWAARLRSISGALGRQPAVLSSSVSLAVRQETKYLVSSEGTAIRQGRGYARIVLSAQNKVADGMNLFTTESFEAADAAGLPKDDVLQAAAGRVAADLEALMRSPAAEPFVGPAILSGRAAGVFFHEIFGHRIEGHRQKDETDGQTFKASIGSKVLPEFLSVVFDPTRRTVGTVDLHGYYQYDDEGVKARPVKLVDGGVLKTFLMSRTPIEGIDRSNGHGRRQPGREVASRQSNLFVESSKVVPEGRLREMLIEEIRRQSKPYGFYFKHVTGGFTTTARRGVQAFKVLPLVVYRVHPDGKPDQLIRGVDIVGTPLSSFAKILATSDREEVFNGYCGAESGSLPVAAVAPAILVSEIEVQKGEVSRDRPPLLPDPALAEGGR